MATRLEKIFWSVIWGTAFGLTGCYASEPPEDADVTDERVDADGPSDMPEMDIAYYGPPDAYPDPLYGAPWDE